jgi:hypothetical protein
LFRPNSAREILYADCCRLIQRDVTAFPSTETFMAQLMAEIRKYLEATRAADTGPDIELRSPAAEQGMRDTGHVTLSQRGYLKRF